MNGLIKKPFCLAPTLEDVLVGVGRDVVICVLNKDFCDSGGGDLPRLHFQKHWLDTAVLCSLHETPLDSFYNIVMPTTHSKLMEEEILAWEIRIFENPQMIPICSDG